MPITPPPPPPPAPPGPLRIVVSLAGLAAVVISLAVAFNDPFGYRHWLLLLLAGGLLVWSRRL